jgi:glucan phosphoethanolaminetransferase (alkaline phosphatase superfamily)
VNILHSLGFFGGTGLWLEEIVNRYYFSTINSFVYFGAAILLILIGVRRFSEAINDQVVIAGIAFEALMLMLMFFIMLFTPNDEISIDNQSSGNSGEEILAEVGEIGRDFAASLIQLEKLNDSFNTIIETQSKLLVNLETVAQNSADASSPNPKMLELMKQTNTALEEFSGTVEKLNQTSKSLLKEEIEITVRREVERILIDKVRQ